MQKPTSRMPHSHLLITLLATLPAQAWAADVQLVPPAGGGVAITNSTATQDNLRVDDNGTVTLRTVPTAGTQNAGVLCYSSAGVLGPCAGSMAGATGATGATGAMGPTGATGVMGPTGAAGAVGATGAAGLPGPTGVQGATGVQGTPGVTGPTGVAGATGATILSGSGTPSNASGSDGDYYLDTNNATLYGPKAAGAWPGSGVSLQGATGPTGAAGATGATGMTGEIGPMGATGDPGLAGPAGATGATGATGPIGTSGPTGETGPAGPTGATGATGPAGSLGGLTEEFNGVTGCAAPPTIVATCTTGSAIFGGCHTDGTNNLFSSWKSTSNSWSCSWDCLATGARFTAYVYCTP